MAVSRAKSSLRMMSATSGALSRFHTCTPKLFSATAWRPQLGNGLARMILHFRLRDSDFGLGIAILLSEAACTIVSLRMDFLFMSLFGSAKAECAKNRKVQQTVRSSSAITCIFNSQSRHFGSTLKQAKRLEVDTHRRAHS